MRQPRLKIPPAEAEAVYHCMSKTVNGEWLLDDTAKEVLRRQIWQVADFSGVQILNYEILSNHFHLLVRVPQKQPVTDAELLRRYRVLHPKPTAYQAARIEVLQNHLVHNDSEAEAWRRQLFARMGDVSPFMQLLKQRFSIWFNKSHGRFGTLWAERFKSVLVEPGNALQTMAAYVDLNCVRAGIVSDPKDYRFCSYAEAVAGNEVAREGIRFLFGNRDWAALQAEYRQMLFGTAAGAREGAALIQLTELKRVLAEGGRLPLATALRCRLRYFTDGAVLGSRAYVETQLGKYRLKHGRCDRTRPRPVPPCTDWGDLATLRSLRQPAIG